MWPSCMTTTAGTRPGSRAECAFCEDHPDCGMVFGEHFDIDGDGRNMGRSSGPLKAGQQEHVAFAREMLRRNLIGTPTVLVRRTGVREGGPSLRRAARHGLRLGDDAAAVARGSGGLPTRVGLRLPDPFASRSQGRPSEAAITWSSSNAMCAQARAAGPQFELRRAERRRLHARYLVSAALDEIEDRNRGAALRLLRAALREHPAVILSPATAAALAGLVVPGARRGGTAARVPEPRAPGSECLS